MCITVAGLVANNLMNSHGNSIQIHPVAGLAGQASGRFCDEME